MTEQKQVRCDQCDEFGDISEMFVVELWDRPFAEKPRAAYFHKVIPVHFNEKYHESCKEFIYERGDFNYFDCPNCGRIICEQNPSNGWMTQYREHFGDQICLKCYEEMILENGIDREHFEEGKLNGMFFSGDNHEPLDAGYLIDERVNNKLIRGGNDAKEVCKIALDYIDKGGKVIIGYESMAIGGLEGYVTLFYKLSDSVNGRVD